MFCVSFFVNGTSCDECIDSEITSTASCDLSQMSSGHFVYDGSFVLSVSDGEQFTGDYFSPLVGFAIDTFYSQQNNWTFEYTLTASHPDSLAFPVTFYFIGNGKLICYQTVIQVDPCLSEPCDGYWWKDISCAYLTDDSTTAVYESGAMSLPVPLGYTLCPGGLTVILDEGFVIVNSAYISGGDLHFNLDAYVPVDLVGEEILFRFILCDSSAHEAICQGIWFTLGRCSGLRSTFSTNSSIDGSKLTNGKISITCRPNPTRGSVTLHRSGEVLPGADINLIDQYGRIVFVDAIAPGQTDAFFNVSNLPSGLYFIAYRGKNEVYFTDKLVILE